MLTYDQAAAPLPCAVLALAEGKAVGADCPNALTAGRGFSERALVSLRFVIFITDDSFKVYNYM